MKNLRKYILNRALTAIPLLLLVSILVFSLIHLIPGDPIDYLFSEETLSEETRQSHRKSLGLDQPLPVQYLFWMGRLLSADLGMSIHLGRPIRELILERLPATLCLAVAAMLVSLLIAIPVGVIAAIKRRSAYDYSFMVLALLGSTLPQFWLGILLILFFSVFLQLLPSSGYVEPWIDPLTSLNYLILPAVTLGTGMAALVARITRSEMLEELGKDYVRTARAKGVPRHQVLLKHTLRNSLVPTITVIGLQFGRLLGGTVIVEHIFAWPGVGSLVVDAIYSRDYPLVQATILTFAFIFLGVNFVVDVLYQYLNPRISLE